MPRDTHAYRVKDILHLFGDQGITEDVILAAIEAGALPPRIKAGWLPKGAVHAWLAQRQRMQPQPQSPFRLNAPPTGSGGRSSRSGEIFEADGNDAGDLPLNGGGLVSEKLIQGLAKAEVGEVTKTAADMTVIQQLRRTQAEADMKTIQVLQQAGLLVDREQLDIMIKDSVGTMKERLDELFDRLPATISNHYGIDTRASARAAAEIKTSVLSCINEALEFYVANQRVMSRSDIHAA